MLIADNQDEVWCSTNFLNHSALRLAVVIRAELLDVMQRIELPVSPPAFGCQDNCTNIKRALLSGFFLKVNMLHSVAFHNVNSLCCLYSKLFETDLIFLVFSITKYEVLTFCTSSYSVFFHFAQLLKMWDSVNMLNTSREGKTSCLYWLLGK